MCERRCTVRCASCVINGSVRGVEAGHRLETQMVDESGSGLGGMRVWAHDSAVTHVVLLVPHDPRFGTAPPRDRPGTECFCHSDLQIRRWCKQQEMFTPGRTHSGVFQVCTGCQGCGSGCTSRVHVKGISEFLFACARTCPAAWAMGGGVTLYVFLGLSHVFTHNRSRHTVGS